MQYESAQIEKLVFPADILYLKRNYYTIAEPSCVDILPLFPDLSSTSPVFSSKQLKVKKICGPSVGNPPLS